MAIDPLTGGYWEVASRRRASSPSQPRSTARWAASRSNKPIVGMAFDPATGGYWEVAADGGHLRLHSAVPRAPWAAQPLNQPIVGMAFDPATGGYWEVAADGGLFAFTAPFHGSMGGKPLNEPIVGMAYDSADRRLLGGGLRRRAVRLHSALPGLDGRQAAQRADRGHGLRPGDRRLLGGGRPTAGCSLSQRRSWARWAARRSIGRSWAWPWASTSFRAAHAFGGSGRPSGRGEAGRVDRVAVDGSGPLRWR